MRKFTTALILFTCLGSQTVNAQCGTNLLNNPSFESPVQPAIGNNLTGLFTFNGGWTMTGGPFNIIKTNGTAYGGGPDNAQNGTQYVDITNAGGTIYQDFTITASTVPVAFAGYFSSREQGTPANWTASIDIVDLGTNTVVSSSNSRVFTNADGAVPAQENWYYLSGNTTLAPGNYRYVANMGNYGNFDNAQVFLNCLLASQLTSFSGAYSNGNTTLNWKCEQSADLSYFEIERSTNGRNFAGIGTKLYSGNQLYHFTDDADLLSEKNYYRIKMVDKDGKFSYSAIISIKTKGDLVLELSPNPVSNQLKISGLKGRGQISIYDISGRVVLRQNTGMVQTLALDVSALNQGMYVLEYFDGANSSVQRFTRQ